MKGQDKTQQHLVQEHAHTLSRIEESQTKLKKDQRRLAQAKDGFTRDAKRSLEITQRFLALAPHDPSSLDMAERLHETCSAANSFFEQQSEELSAEKRRLENKEEECNASYRAKMQAFLTDNEARHED